MVSLVTTPGSPTASSMTEMQRIFSFNVGLPTLGAGEEEGGVLGENVGALVIGIGPLSSLESLEESLEPLGVVGSGLALGKLEGTSLG